MTTQGVKELIGIRTYKQLSLYADKQERSINRCKTADKTKIYQILIK